MTPAPPSPPTDALVQALVRDLAPVRRLRGVDSRAALWMAAATACTLVLTLAIGARPDLAARLADPGQLAETAALLLAFLGATRCGFQLSVPGLAPTALQAVVPAVALAIWILHIAERWSTGAAELAAMSWPGGLPCVARLLALALVPIAIGVRMLRRAAPGHRRWAGLCLALAAGSLAMLGTQMICPRDAAGHVLVWHVAPVAALALLGGALGRRALGTRRRPRTLAVA